MSAPTGSKSRKGTLRTALGATLVLGLGTAFALQTPGCGDAGGATEPQGGDPAPAPTAQALEPVRYEADLIQDPDVVQLLDEKIALVEANPKSSTAHRALGLVYEANDQFPMAIASFRNALQLDPDSLILLLHIASSQNGDGQKEAYLATMREAEALLPRYQDPRHALDRTSMRMMLGIELLDRGELQEAREQFELILAEDESVVQMRSPAQFGLAEVLLEEDQAQAAMTYIQAGLETLPGDLYGQFLLGRAYQDQGNTLEGERLLDIGSGAAPRMYGNSLSNEIQSYAVSKSKRLKLVNDMADMRDPQQNAEALQILLQMRETYPDDEVVLNNLAALQMRNGLHKDALEVLKQILAQDPKQFPAWYNVSFCHLTQGDRARLENRVDEAIAHYQESLIAAENAVLHGPQVAEMHLQLAKAQMVNKRSVEAIASLKEALRLGSEDRDIYFNLAVMESHIVGPQKALETMHRCLEKHPNYIEGRLTLARWYLELKDTAGALDQYLELMRRAPQNKNLPNLAAALGRNYQKDLREFR